MQHTKISIIFIAIICVSAQCHKPCNESNYLFETTAKFSPQFDSIQVGDTIWLTSLIPKPVLDKNSGKTIAYENANWCSTLIISDILKFKESNRGAISDFDFSAKIGNIYSAPLTDTTNVKQISYQEYVMGYELNIAIIARKAGSYILTIPDNQYLFRKNKPKCGTAELVILNENTDKHLSLFEDVWGSLSAYDKAHCYCVKVH